MTIEGKGFYLWQVRNCEKGDARAIAETAVTAGLTHVLVKIADGIYAYNYDYKTKTDLARPVVDALKEAGIAVWGWHYVYGVQPVEEARIAVRRVQELGLEGYVIDAEAEYKDPEKKSAATRFMNELRKDLKAVPVALSSYRYPSYHTRLPWQEFLNQCDYNMPQVYWVKSHNPAEQLQRSLREFQDMKPFRPIVPTGAAFTEQGWTASADEVLEFMQTAQRLNLSAVNFWSWDFCRNNLPNLWNTIAQYPWSGEETPDNPAAALIACLNDGDLDRLLTLYDENAVHITAARTVQGKDAIRAWYADLLNENLPGAQFTVTSAASLSASSHHFTWKASSPQASVLDGKDTIGTIDGRITYHYTSFDITRK